MEQEQILAIYASWGWIISGLFGVLFVYTFLFVVGRFRRFLYSLLAAAALGSVAVTLFTDGAVLYALLPAVAAILWFLYGFSRQNYSRIEYD